MENLTEKKYRQAQRQVKKIQGFYVHLMIYIVVNILLSIAITFILMENGFSFKDAFFKFGTIGSWGIWGIGIFIHAFITFDFFFGKGWQQKKITKILKEEEAK